jgi:hypothetical protein
MRSFISLFNSCWNPKFHTFAIQVKVGLPEEPNPSMKKLVILMIVLMFIVLVSVVRAHENGHQKAGGLLFFYKCDENLIGTSSPCRAVVAKMVPEFPYDDDEDNDDDADDGDDDLESIGWGEEREVLKEVNLSAAREIGKSRVRKGPSFLHISSSND